LELVHNPEAAQTPCIHTGPIITYHKHVVHNRFWYHAPWTYTTADNYMQTAAIPLTRIATEIKPNQLTASAEKGKNWNKN